MKKGEFLAVFQILILFVAIVAVADLVSAADDDEDSEEGEDESRGWFGKVWGFASLPAKKLVVSCQVLVSVNSVALITTSQMPIP